MNYDKFREELLIAANEKSEDFKFAIKDIKRADGDSYEGLVAQKANIPMPVYSVHRLYDMYTECRNMPVIIEELFKFLDKELMYSESFNKVLRDINNYEKIKHKVRIKLSNCIDGEDFPYVKRDWLDLSIVYYICVDENKEYSANTYVLKQLLEQWQITEDQLYLDAMNNLEFESYRIENMFDSFSSMVDINSSFLDIPDDCVVKRMLILTMDRGYGASAILCENVKKDLIARMGDECVLLPSSKHEWFCVSADSIKQDKENDSDRLRFIVKEVNQTQVDEKDFLSNNIYYLKKDLSIEIIE